MAKRSRQPRESNVQNGKSGHDPIRLMPLDDLKPSPENDELYRPVNNSDPEIRKLSSSIAARGILEPLVISKDGFVISGHRRLAAAKLAGLDEVPCRTLDISRSEDREKFIRTIRECNRQRDKSLAEKLREELVAVNPTTAYQSLREHRRTVAALDVDCIELSEGRERSVISAAKQPFLDAIRKVIHERRKFWPLSDRQIHYALLNDPPLRHASKPASRYANDPSSYKSLVDILTRGRLDGSITMGAIADLTRPVTIWKVHENPRSFISSEFQDLLSGYYRDLMQTQPNHIEIVGEKNTIASIIKPVAAEFTIPVTIGRGYCSLPPRYAMAKRFEDSGKEQLVLLILSDFDPDGEEIAQSFARSLRDDFDVDDVYAVKVALTADQVEQFQLPPSMLAKKSSVHHGKFTSQHGSHAYELEALQPAELQEILREAIESVIDQEMFDAEVEAEKKDASYLAGVRKTLVDAAKSMDLKDLE